MFSFEPSAGRVATASGTAVVLTVAAGPEAPAAARNAVGAGLVGRIADDVLRDARLLVSELVTNSVRHAGLAADGVVRISADMTGGILRLEVDDAGTAGTVSARGSARARRGERMAHGIPR